MKVSSPRATAQAEPAEKAAALTLCAAVLHDTLVSLHRADPAVTYDVLGARTGSKAQHVGEWCNALSGRTVALYKIVMMGPRVAPAILRALAAAIEAQGASKGGASDLRKIVCDVMARVGELARSVNEGVADGSLNGAEIATIEADAHRIRAALSEVDAGLARARATLAGGRRGR